MKKAKKSNRGKWKMYPKGTASVSFTNGPIGDDLKITPPTNFKSECDAFVATFGKSENAINDKP